MQETADLRRVVQQHNTEEEERNRQHMQQVRCGLGKRVRGVNHKRWEGMRPSRVGGEFVCLVFGFRFGGLGRLVVDTYTHTNKNWGAGVEFLGV